ncbi:MAG: SDR family oxidoreductase [Anaerolineae bacterium]|jgi:NAD(P)-dependent dehydrogenase (short-subunit alcohol dehydrogenase family)
MELRDSVAFVTGGAQRVGKVISLALAERGAHVAFTYRSSDPEETLSGIQAQGVEGLALHLDVLEWGRPEAVVEEVVARFGRLDLLVNNASVWLSSPFLEITREHWETSMGANLTGPFLCAQAVAPHMLRQGSGLIINITDLSAFQTWAGYAHHSASKAGLVALTRVMAAELAPHVRVNAIAPGTVLLPEGASEEKQRWARENSLLKRVGEPEDVAKTVLFLAEMDFVTGAVYFVDGGRALV